MTTRLYLWLVSSVCTAFVLSTAWLAAMLHFAHQRPERPRCLSNSSVWRPTLSERFSLRPHGDWIECRDEGLSDYCRIADAAGAIEYEGSFARVPGLLGVPNAQLRPVTSDTILPWMWSARAGRQVPLIHLENGAVLAPQGSGPDLRRYVERTRDFGVHVKPLPLYAQYYHPAGGS